MTSRDERDKTALTYAKRARVLSIITDKQLNEILYSFRSIPRDAGEFKIRGYEAPTDTGRWILDENPWLCAVFIRVVLSIGFVFSVYEDVNKHSPKFAAFKVVVKPEWFC